MLMFQSFLKVSKEESIQNGVGRHQAGLRGEGRQDRPRWLQEASTAPPDVSWEAPKSMKNRCQEICYLGLQILIDVGSTWHSQLGHPNLDESSPR